MSRNFSARDITGFLDASIGAFLRDIEGIAIEMLDADDREDRIALLTDIQDIIYECNDVLR